MVARIKPTADLAKALRYNEEKVAQRTAEILEANGFLGDKNRMTYDQKLRRLQDQNDLNTRARYKTLHATLNFHPEQTFSNDQLRDIAQRYMRGLELDQHPYLVYRHNDQGHPHIHIVASLIDDHGRRLNTHHLAERKSEPTRKTIEQEFHLQRTNAATKRTEGPVHKVNPARDEPLVHQIQRVTTHAVQQYTFGSLPEYNAILRMYNVSAETGGSGSKTRQHQGLYYTALDDQGHKMAPPIMSSRISGRPTLQRLEKKFAEAPASRRETIPSIRSRIDAALEQQPRNIKELSHSLTRQEIDIILPPAQPHHDPIYLDHRTRTAISASNLGDKYNDIAILTKLSHISQQKHSQRPSPNANAKKETFPHRKADPPSSSSNPDLQPSFNPRVSQPLSVLIGGDDPGTTPNIRQAQRPKM